MCPFELLSDVYYQSLVCKVSKSSFSSSLLSELQYLNHHSNIQSFIYTNMVALATVRASNARLSTNFPGLVAVFVGATSSKGEFSLKALAGHEVAPPLLQSSASTYSSPTSSITKDEAKNQGLSAPHPSLPPRPPSPDCLSKSRPRRRQRGVRAVESPATPAAPIPKNITSKTPEANASNARQPNSKDQMTNQSPLQFQGPVTPLKPPPLIQLPVPKFLTVHSKDMCNRLRIRWD